MLTTEVVCLSHPEGRLTHILVVPSGAGMESNVADSWNQLPVLRNLEVTGRGIGDPPTKVIPYHAVLGMTESKVTLA